MPRTPTWWAGRRPLAYRKRQSRLETVSLTLLLRHFLPSNQVPVRCPKYQKLPFALRPFKFLEREKTKNELVPAAAGSPQLAAEMKGRGLSPQPRLTWIACTSSLSPELGLQVCTITPGLK